MTMCHCSRDPTSPATLALLVGAGARQLVFIRCGSEGPRGALPSATMNRLADEGVHM